MRKRRTQLNRAIENLLMKLEMEMATHHNALHDLDAVREYLTSRLEYEPDDAVPTVEDEPVDGLPHVALPPEWNQ